MNGVNQFIYCFKTVSFGNIGEMSIAGGGFRACVSEYSLDLVEAYTAFKQMGCKAVAEGVDMDFFLMPHS